MKLKSARTLAALAIILLLLALVVATLALENGGDVLMIGLGLLLAATSMELFRRAQHPTP